MSESVGVALPFSNQTARCCLSLFMLSGTVDTNTVLVFLSPHTNSRKPALSYEIQ